MFSSLYCVNMCTWCIVWDVCECLWVFENSWHIFSCVSCLDLCICFSTLHSPQFQVNFRSTQESRWSPVQVCNYSRSCKKRDLEACFSVFMSLYYVFAMWSPSDSVLGCFEAFFISFHFFDIFGMLYIILWWTKSNVEMCIVTHDFWGKSSFLVCFFGTW